MDPAEAAVWDKIETQRSANKQSVVASVHQVLRE
jgi:hypothetical protein